MTGLLEKSYFFEMEIDFVLFFWQFLKIPPQDSRHFNGTKIAHYYIFFKMTAIMAIQRTKSV